MSFDIEKRFRFVSSDDINDDVKESDYIEEDISNGVEEDVESAGKAKKEKKETPESGLDDLEKDKFKELDDEFEEEEEEDDE